MLEAPTGTVTFLFTDIEGSTKMWERHPEAMQSALSRHDDILRKAIEERGGYVFKTMGDAFCCAFSKATDALEAALEAQRTLLGEEWEEAGPLNAWCELSIEDLSGRCPLARVSLLTDPEGKGTDSSWSI